MIHTASILDSRERHVKRRFCMHDAYPNHTIIQLTLSIPGAIKDSFLLRELFKEGITQLHQAFPSIAMEELYFDPTGPQGLLALHTDSAYSIKERACQIETAYPYARLFDIDIYDSNRQTISSPYRKQGRTCLLCNHNAVVCMRLRKHSAAELQNKIQELLTEFKVEKTKALSSQAIAIGALATEAALFEAAAFPSPGLVDPIHSGSHTDMDFFTFLSSSAALSHYFSRFFQAGAQHAEPLPTLFPTLRILGQQAENAMFQSTQQINTHKGLIFSMALLLGTAGYLSRQTTQLSSSLILKELPFLTQNLTKELAVPNQKPTAGQRFFQIYGITGIRGEAENGFPSIRLKGLPTLSAALHSGIPLRKALLKTLFSLMSVVEDTAILNRQPTLSTLREVQSTAAKVIQQGLFESDDWEKQLWNIDREFTAQRLSPGGSADMLSLTYFLYKLDHSTTF